MLSSSFSLISLSHPATSRPAEAMKRVNCSSSSLSPTFSRMDISSFIPMFSSSSLSEVAKRFSACMRMGLTGCDARLMPLSFKKYSRRRLLSAMRVSMLTFIFSRSRPEASLKNAVTQTPRFSVAMYPYLSATSSASCSCNLILYCRLTGGAVCAGNTNCMRRARAVSLFIMCPSSWPITNFSSSRFIKSNRAEFMFTICGSPSSEDATENAFTDESPVM